MKTAKEFELLALKHENQKQWKEALQSYQKLFELTKNKKILNKIAYIYSQLQEHKKAVAYFHTYLKENEDVYAYHNLGVEYFHLKDFEKAVLALKKSIQMNPDFLRSHLLLGYIYEALEKYEESLKYFHYVLGKDPKNRIAALGIVFSLIKLNRYDVAKKQCEVLFKLYPNDLTLKNLYSGILLQLGETKEFIEEIKELSEKDNRYKSFDAYVQKLKLTREKETQDFLKELNQKLTQKTIELEKKQDKKSYLDLSIMYLFSGDKEKAFDALQKALESSETN